MAPEIGYVIRRISGSYLERTPFDGSYSFLAGSGRYATVFTAAVAMALAQRLLEAGTSVTIERDYDRRAPEITDTAAARAAPLSV